MKILMCADNFGGPTTTFIYNDFKYMSNIHDVMFLCTRRNDQRNKTLKNVKVISYNRSFIQRVFSRFDISMNYKNKEYAKKLNTFISDFSPDVIHCNFGKESLKILDNLENKNIPIIIQFRGYDASSALNSKSYINRLKEVLSKDNVIPIFVAKSLQKNLERKGVIINKSHILYSGINLEKFVPDDKLKKADDKKIFLQISSLVEKKGHEYTIKAFANFLKNKDKTKYKLILSGDGTRKKILQNLTVQLGISNNVDFIGYVTPDEAIELMKQANIFVHHSITANNGDQEGIPNAIMEAMSMKLPIISTLHSGIPELIKDGKNGFLVKEKDIKTYSEKMNKIIDWNEIEENRDIIKNKFEMIIHNKKLESIYKDIV